MSFFSKSEGLSDELPRYGVVIILSFIADIGTLFVFKNYCNLSLTVSVIASYAIGVYVNYVLSSHWVFGTRRFKSDFREPLYFWLIAAFGGAVSLLAIRLLDAAGMNLAVAKILAEGSVAVLSFGGKKVFLFSDFDGYKRVVKLYKKSSPSTRVHTLIRYVTMPYKRLAASVPEGASSLVEIGAGHGLIARLMKEDCKLENVYAYDIDADKIKEAKGNSGGVTFATKRPAKGMQFDVVVIADVLYLLDEKAKEAMLTEAYELCKAGGTILVKEMALSPKWKCTVNQLQETISVKVMRITDFKDKPTLELLDLELVAKKYNQSGSKARVVRIDQGFIHPHAVLVITKEKS